MRGPGVRLPFGSRGDLLDEVSPARVPEIAQTVGDRVDARLRRQFIDIGFVGERVGQGGHAPQPGRARDRRHIVDDHPMIGEIVRADRRAVAHLGNRGRRRNLACEDQRQRRRGVGWIAGGEVIGHDAAARVEPAVDAHELARALRLPLMLLIARQLHPDRAADRAGEQRGVGGRVVRAVAPVAPGGFHPDHLDGVFGKVEKQREVAPHP